MQHRQSVLFAAALAASLACAGPAIAATTYNAVDVGSFGNQTFATGLNNLGQVVGYGPSGSFITDANGTNFRTLTFGLGEGAKAFGINDAGQIVGNYFDTGTGKFLAFATDANGTNAHAVNTLDGTFATATAINNDGQISGSATRPSGSQAFIGDASGSAPVTYLSLPGGQNVAYAINASGQVAGAANVSIGGANYVVRPFVSGADGTLPISSVQPGGTFDRGLAQGINDAGWMVGSYTVNQNGMGYAFVAGPGGATPVILPKMWSYGQSDVANDINNLGQIVGQGTVFSGGFNVKRAFISDVDTLAVTDLNTLLATALPENVFLMNAVGINDLGQIAVTGSDYHVYLLNPVAVPEPSTVSFALLGLAAGGLVARRHRKARDAARHLN